MKIHDFVSAMNGGDDHEFRIYTDAEQPVFEGFSSEIPEDRKDAEIDCFEIGTDAIEIVIK